MLMMKTSLFTLISALVLYGNTSASGIESTTHRISDSGKWTHGMPTSASYFPIAVWLQSPENAVRYKAAGINLYIGLWEGPTETQLSILKSAGMPVICAQNAVGLAHKDDSVIVGWMHGDEPDNAQLVKDPVTGKEGYGPCIPPAKIVEEYHRIQALDPTRPVLLNMGQGVANDDWVGRGSGAKLEDYETYVHGGDMISYDVYPVAGLDRPDSEKFLWYVPKGIDRLTKWSAGQKSIWNCIECTKIDSTHKASPKQVRAEVWMSLIHGSKGLVYFVHQFKPKFNEHALLDDPEMLKEVTSVNQQIRMLAPVLNSPNITNASTVQTSSKDVPIDIMVKHFEGSSYIFTVGMRNSAVTGTFRVPVLMANAAVEVIGESRLLTAKNGQFTDSFRPYDVHIYHIPTADKHK